MKRKNLEKDKFGQGESEQKDNSEQENFKQIQI